MRKVILVVHGTCVAIIFEKSRLLSNIEALQINLPVILEGNVQRPHPFLHIFSTKSMKSILVSIKFCSYDFVLKEVPNNNDSTHTVNMC